MKFEGMKIGFALTGSFCTLDEVFGVMRKLAEDGADIVPIMSHMIANTDTRFGKAEQWKQKCVDICGKEPLCSVIEVEPLGPARVLDCLVIAPCTGNTLAKLAGGITDGPVLMAAKAQLRNSGPVVLAISTNDALGANAKNIGSLMCQKNMYFVPFGQDNPWQKANSLISHMQKIPETIYFACQRKQIQPVLEDFLTQEAN
ncbi:MAG: dipicolinate synthase subunit B [Peptococcaceae bacterium]|nr:dipicolinate synthase subunit B [Peptococcaceae bacterium]